MASLPRADSWRPSSLGKYVGISDGNGGHNDIHDLPTALCLSSGIVVEDHRLQEVQKEAFFCIRPIYPYTRKAYAAVILTCGDNADVNAEGPNAPREADTSDQ